MKMRITTKIMVGFGLMVILTVLVGGYGLSRLADVRDTTATIFGIDSRASELLRRVAVNQERMKVLRERAVARYVFQRDGLIEGDPLAIQEQWRQAREEALEQISELERVATEHEQTGVSVERQLQWRAIERNVAEIRAALSDISQQVESDFAFLNQGNLVALADSLTELAGLRGEFDERIDEGAQLVQDLVRLGSEEARAAYQEARTSIFAVLFAAIALAIVASFSIKQSISRPLADFMGFAERVGKGDLTQRAKSTNTDELGALGKSLNEMVAGLTELAGQTREATQNLRSSSSEILASTQQQVASMTEQTAAVQETSSTMDEINESGMQVAERAKEVSAAAEATSSNTQAGLTAVQAMTRAMDGIREQAQSVAETIVALSEKTQAVEEIVATVNDIAEQSHLLALNASIEAAAAGESGRGFSVVAHEMKNLADQAKDATVQVRTMLSEIQRGINTSVMLTEEAVKRVESGRQQADVAEQTIEQLGSSVQDSVRAFQQIVAATNQQQIGFDQVSHALKNITQAIDQAASGNRQLEGAASNLTALSQQLEQSIQRYTV